jgi:DNA-binding transcriptional LysR family regulator
MLDWDKLKLFYQIAEAGSFTEAAKRLNGSQSALSRQIQALEAALGAALFHRHARGLALTHEGEQLLAAARDMAERVETTARAIQETRTKPSGELRLTTTVGFGSTWLPRHLKAFFDLYPDIRLDLLLADEELDLSRRQADVAIRFNPPRQSDLIQRPLAHVRFMLCGAPDYLKRYGVPQEPGDLDQHRLLAFGQRAPDELRDINWALSLGNDNRLRTPFLAINNIYGLLQAVEAGIGLAALPDYLIKTSPNLQPVLRQVTGPSFQTYFVYPSELRRSVRVAVLRDFLLSQIEADQFTS